jgi:hypothetical protein
LKSNRTLLPRWECSIASLIWDSLYVVVTGKIGRRVEYQRYFGRSAGRLGHDRTRLFLRLTLTSSFSVSEECLDANALPFLNRLDSKGACESSLASFPEVRQGHLHDAEDPGSQHPPYTDSQSQPP